jgi:hypothetical protein
MVTRSRAEKRYLLEISPRSSESACKWYPIMVPNDVPTDRWNMSLNTNCGFSGFSLAEDMTAINIKEIVLS